MGRAHQVGHHASFPVSGSDPYSEEHGYRNDYTTICEEPWREEEMLEAFNGGHALFLRTVQGKDRRSE